MQQAERNEFEAWFRAMSRKCGSAFEREVMSESREHLWCQWVNANMKYGYHGPSGAELLHEAQS